MTSGLDYLVIDDYLVRKRGTTSAALADFQLWLSPCSQLTSTLAFAGKNQPENRYEVVRNYDRLRRRKISEQAHEVIAAAKPGRVVADVLAQCGINGDRAALMDELFDLWSDRFVMVSPEARATP